MLVCPSPAAFYKTPFEMDAVGDTLRGLMPGNASLVDSHALAQDQGGVVASNEVPDIPFLRSVEAPSAVAWMLMFPASAAVDAEVLHSFQASIQAAFGVMSQDPGAIARAEVRRAANDGSGGCAEVEGGVAWWEWLR